ncbi:MAG: DUF47 family protein [Pseudomonadota bacterium]
MDHSQRLERDFPQPPFTALRKLISGLRLFPKTHDFFGYFERGSENTVSGAKILCRMIANRAERPVLLKELENHEHVGDRLTHEVIDLLRETFLTPFDRSDIHTLVVKMDDVLDIVYFIGNRMTRYDISEMPDELAELAEIILKSSEEIAKAIRGLRHLKNTQEILTACVEINRLENEADARMDSLIEGLFKDGWDPFEVIKLKELAENLEAAVDKCEDVANIIEGIILKHA